MEAVGCMGQACMGQAMKWNICSDFLISSLNWSAVRERVKSMFLNWFSVVFWFIFFVRGGVLESYFLNRDLYFVEFDECLDWSWLFFFFYKQLFVIVSCLRPLIYVPYVRRWFAPVFRVYHVCLLVIRILANFWCVHNINLNSCLRRRRWTTSCGVSHTIIVNREYVCY